ncbi:hypothetical protein [Puia dinghuensis]|uniref:Uncharacterized protein n=1 Tax=Puia dinghuensis TaxID=1792502 RepID=A0A8J2U8S8_9BACT|nr:hypothetical protein [Puia dinghuensis]GGA86856.1 hypothetical protein GCM10011511_07410 [Puia dinghuensis]
MELKKLLQQWNSFPELSMEERPVLSSDLEKIVVKNPLSNAFYLKKKLTVRIAIIFVLWLVNSWQFRHQWLADGNELYPQGLLFILLTYSLYFHIRLLLFADYPTLLALPLLNFLGKLETILDKYILSFRLVSAIAGFYLLFGVEWLLSRLSTGAYKTLSNNDWYKWLILIFLSVSFYILLLHTIIPRYLKVLNTVKKYKEGINAKAPVK